MIERSKYDWKKDMQDKIPFHPREERQDKLPLLSQLLEEYLGTGQRRIAPAVETPERTTCLRCQILATLSR
jgi:hypothetical protein